MTPKTKRMINLVCLAVWVLGLVLLLSWFFLRGAEIRFGQELNDASEILLIKQTWNHSTGDYETEESPLTQEQLNEALTLVKKNAFWRMLSGTITHNEDVTYTVYCEFTRNDYLQYLNITFIGDYAVTVSSSVDAYNCDAFLKILNKNLLPKLEAILAK